MLGITIIDWWLVFFTFRFVYRNIHTWYFCISNKSERIHIGFDQKCF